MRKRYILIHDICLEKQICGQIFISKSQELIGTYEFHVINEDFMAAINIFPDFQNKGIGFFVFKSCYEELNVNNNLKKFIVSWNVDKEYAHLSDEQSINFSVFLNSIKNGLTEIEALWTAPTGKWLNKLGFTSGRILKRDNDKLTAIFTKGF